MRDCFRDELKHQGEGMDVFAGTVGILGGGILLVVGCVLLFLLPFFVYGTNVRTKETALALRETNKLLAEIRDRLPVLPK